MMMMMMMMIRLVLIDAASKELSNGGHIVKLHYFGSDGDGGLGRGPCWAETNPVFNRINWQKIDIFDHDAITNR